jgi:hypothetical protein
MKIEMAYRHGISEIGSWKKSIENNVKRNENEREGWKLSKWNGIGE